jgi:hypothetical protein
MKTDALDTGLIFGVVGAFQASPPVGFAIGLAAVGIAVARRSTSVQTALLGDTPALESRAAKYFFKTDPKALPAPKQPKAAAPQVETIDLAFKSEMPTFDFDDEPANATGVAAPVAFARPAASPKPLPAPAAPVAIEAPKPDMPQARIEGNTIYIYIGRNPHSGQAVYAPVKHGVAANSTGGGKTNALDLVTGQLVAADIEVWAATPKYVPIDPNDGLPRHLIYDRIAKERKALKPNLIPSWIARAAQVVEQRYDRMQSEPGWFPAPMVVILDELKALLRIMGKRRDDRNMVISDQINNDIQTILTLGRECNVFFIFTSQDGYCGSIEMTRGEIGNLGFRLVHPSLDENSQKNLLPPNVPSASMLGPYDWYCAIGNTVHVVSIPRVSREMLAAWGFIDAPKQATTVQQPEQVDPWAEWTAQLLALPVAPEEPSIHKAVASAVKRGKASKQLVLAICNGDEAEAFRALEAAGMARRDVCKMWGGNTAATLERIQEAIGGKQETLFEIVENA